MSSSHPTMHHDDVIKWNIFRVTGPLCGEFTGPGEYPAQMPVTRSFDVFFDLRLNNRLSKQPGGWWFETPPWTLWRQCNDHTEQKCADFCSAWCILGYGIGVSWHLRIWSITHPSDDYKGGLVKPQLTLGHGQVITSHINLWMKLLIHVLLLVLVQSMIVKGFLRIGLIMSLNSLWPIFFLVMGYYILFF